MFRGQTTFLDESSFLYKDEVIKYFNAEATPIADAEDFLDTLEAVLEATTQRESKSRREVEVDPVKEAVRSRFIGLYRSNQDELQEQVGEHDVYAMVPKTVAFEEEDYGSYVPYAAFPSRHNPMVAEIDKYVEMQDSAVKKYLDESSPADPCDHPDEFYALYTAILRNCPKAPSFASSSSSSAFPVEDTRATLRSQFDRIYEDNSQGLGKCWSEDHGAKAREIEQLRSMSFVPSFRSSPSVEYRSGGGFPHPQTHGDYSFSSSPAAFLMPPRDSFETLRLRLGEFDFERHGLDGISKRVVAFYDAAPNINLLQGTLGYSSGSAHQGPRTRFPLGERDLFMVLKEVLTQLKPAEVSLLAKETIDSVVRSRFIEIFHFAAAADSESQGGLTEHQTAEINALVGHSERASFRPQRPPQSWLGSSSLSSGGRKPPSGGGSGGNPIVKVGLLLLALYLGYRLAKPAYQWIRGNQTTPVGE